MSKIQNQVKSFSFHQASVNTDSWSEVVDSNVAKRLDGKTASFKTQKERRQAIYLFKEELENLGVTGIYPKNLKKKHIQMVVAVWEQKLGPSSLQNYFTHVKAMFAWIGKENVVGRLEDYLNDPSKGKRIYAALKDKSWDKLDDIGKPELLQRIRDADYRVWLQTIAQDAFGLRKKEAICFKPHQDIVDGKLYVRRGAKGGRNRVIPLNSDQLEVAEFLKSQLQDTNSHLGDPHKTLKQNMTRYSNVLYRLNIKQAGVGALGVTGHGLRAGFAMRTFRGMGGSLPILTEPISLMTPAEDHALRLKLAEYLGHSRVSVTAAYYGPSTLRGLTKLSKSAQKQLIGKVLDLRQGATYAFGTKAFTTPDLVKVPARSITGIYAESVGIGENYYLKIVDAFNGVPENINVDYLDSVKLVSVHTEMPGIKKSHDGM